MQIEKLLIHKQINVDNKVGLIEARSSAPDNETWYIIYLAVIHMLRDTNTSNRDTFYPIVVALENWLLGTLEHLKTDTTDELHILTIADLTGLPLFGTGNETSVPSINREDLATFWTSAFSVLLRAGALKIFKQLLELKGPGLDFVSLKGMDFSAFSGPVIKSLASVKYTRDNIGSFVLDGDQIDILQAEQLVVAHTYQTLQKRKRSSSTQE